MKPVILELLVAFLLVGEVSYAECKGSISSNYATLYDLKDEPLDLLKIEVEMTKNKIVMALVAAQNNCGAHGCEYAGYLLDVSGCPFRVIDFIGSYEMGDFQDNGFKSIYIRENKNSSLSCEWTYQPIQQKFTVRPDSCTQRKPSSLIPKKNLKKH